MCGSTWTTCHLPTCTCACSQGSRGTPFPRSCSMNAANWSRRIALKVRVTSLSLFSLSLFSFLFVWWIDNISLIAFFLFFFFKGCKLNDVNIVYTPWSNLKKTGDMVVGQVGFFSNKQVRKFCVLFFQTFKLSNFQTFKLSFELPMELLPHIP